MLLRNHFRRRFSTACTWQIIRNVKISSVEVCVLSTYITDCHMTYAKTVQQKNVSRRHNVGALRHKILELAIQWNDAKEGKTSFDCGWNKSTMQQSKLQGHSSIFTRLSTIRSPQFPVSCQYQACRVLICCTIRSLLFNCEPQLLQLFRSH